MWQEDNVHGCIQALSQMSDVAVTVEFLHASQTALSGNVLTLSMCQDLLPLLKDLVTSSFEQYITVTLHYLKMLLSSFTSVILVQFLFVAMFCFMCALFRFLSLVFHHRTILCFPASISSIVGNVECP